jgi:hypothetical protein
MKCYDPRDPKQDVDKPATWKETDNPALIMAVEIADDLAARGAQIDAGFWSRVEMLANYCDERVTHAKV